MNRLLAVSVAITTLGAAAPAMAHDCGCRVRHVAVHHPARHLHRASVRRVVVVREPVIVRERVVVHEPVYIQEPPIVLRERVWRPAPYRVHAWGGEGGYAAPYDRAARFGDRPYGWRERGGWDHRDGREDRRGHDGGRGFGGERHWR